MIKKRVFLVSVAVATLAVGLFPAPAQAVPTCPPGAMQFAWAPTVSPDRNGNGVICIRFVGREGERFVLTDDRDPDL